MLAAMTVAWGANCRARSSHIRRLRSRGRLNPRRSRWYSFCKRSRPARQSSRRFSRSATVSSHSVVMLGRICANRRTMPPTSRSGIAHADDSISRNANTTPIASARVESATPCCVRYAPTVSHDASSRRYLTMFLTAARRSETGRDGASILDCGRTESASRNSYRGGVFSTLRFGAIVSGRRSWNGRRISGSASVTNLLSGNNSRTGATTSNAGGKSSSGTTVGGSGASGNTTGAFAASVGIGGAGRVNSTSARASRFIASVTSSGCAS